MNYAIVEDGIVTNIVVLYPMGAKDFPEAVPCGDIPVFIGDTYDGEHFFRAGKRVLTPLEQARKDIESTQANIEDTEDMRAALAVLGINGETEAGQ